MDLEMLPFQWEFQDAKKYRKKNSDLYPSNISLNTQTV